MTLGVPVVAANRGALPEVLGDAGPLVDADDAAGFAEAIDSTIDDPVAATSATARGSERARQFSWERDRGDDARCLQSGCWHVAPTRGGLTCGSASTRANCAAQPTGVGRYLGGLLHEWADAERARRHEFVLYAHQPIAVPLDARRFPTRVVAGQRRHSLGTAATPAGGRTRPSGCLLRARLHGAALCCGCRSSSRSTTSRLPRIPNGSARAKGCGGGSLTRRSRRRARAITTISEFSKREIVELSRACRPTRFTSFLPASTAARHQLRPPAATASRRRCTHPLRRLDLQPPARARPHSRLRPMARRHHRCCGWISSATTAAIHTKTCGDDCPRAASMTGFAGTNMCPTRS